MRYEQKLVATALIFLGSSSSLTAADSIELLQYKRCMLSVAASLSDNPDTVDLMLFDSLEMPAAEMKRLNERAVECRNEADLATISMIEKSSFSSRATTMDRGIFARYLEQYMIAKIVFEME